MKTHSLYHRFVVAGFMIVLATVGNSIWCEWTFLRLHQMVDITLGQNQKVVDFSTALHVSLEREDDALVREIIEKSNGIRLLKAERSRGQEILFELENSIPETDYPVLTELKEHIQRYQAEVDSFLKQESKQNDWKYYHTRIIPLLHRAVSGCDSLREAHFQSMQQVNIATKYETSRDAKIVALIGIGTIIVGIAVATWLTRSVLRPIEKLTTAFEAVGTGDFNQRIEDFPFKEFDAVKIGFNRMVQSLADYRKSSIDELLTAKRTLEATLNALPDAVYLFHSNGELIANNPPAQAILAATGNSNSNTLMAMPFSEEHLCIIRESLKGKVEKGNQLDFSKSIRISNKDSSRLLSMQTIPVPEISSGHGGVVVVLHDVTDFVRLDELRSELIGMASHELRTPLTGIQMNLLMLRELMAELPQIHQQLIDSAVESCSTLGSVIEELLDVTRIEAGQLRLNSTEVDLNHLLSSVKSSFETRFSDANVILKLDLCEKEVRIQADQSRIRTVIANVLENALKYSPPGGLVDLSVQSAQLESHDSVQIACTDMGPGVPEIYRSRIFEKFFRVEHYCTHPTKEVRGTGIGLYLCQQIIQAHGGKMECHGAQAGVGTKIAIILPVIRSTAKAKEKQ